jgi:hypothetical protein
MVECPAPPGGLHDAQQQVVDNLGRFNVVAAGRRFGKTHLAAKLACWYARHSHWADGTDLAGSDVWYVSPTMDLALEQVAPLILDELGDELDQFHKVQNWFRLTNGNHIRLKSSQRPENLRGRSLRAVILDEVSIMPPGLWETIIRPALVDKGGHALFIGTPVGKGKLYDLMKHAEADDTGLWRHWAFKTVDNPLLPAGEVELAKKSMSAAQFRQELLADFETGGGNVFKSKQLKQVKRAPLGVTQMACVFGSDAPFSKDSLAVSGTESAMIVLRMHPSGWHVVSAQRGFWSVSETIKRLSDAWKEHKPRFLALSEKDAKAAENLIEDFARHGGARMRLWPITDAEDIDRIKWALQSRLKEGKVTAGPGRGRTALANQLQDFPLQYSNNELVRALSYFDQLPSPNFGRHVRERFHVIDAIAGY